MEVEQVYDLVVPGVQLKQVPREKLDRALEDEEVFLIGEALLGAPFDVDLVQFFDLLRLNEHCDQEPVGDVVPQALLIDFLERPRVEPEELIEVDLHLFRFLLAIETRRF